MFTVVIPLYNKELSVKNTINSVLNQTFTDFELIIVNDGSTDNSLSVVKSIVDDRIKIIDKPNGGVSSARNTGIRAASREWIALLDGDDLWAEYHLQSIIEAIYKYTNIKVVSNNYTTVRNLFEKAKYDTDDFLFIENYFKDRGQFSVWSSCIVVKREMFDLVGYFPENINHGEDVDMWVRLARKTSFVINQRISALYNLEAEGRVMKKKINYYKCGVSLIEIERNTPPEEKQFQMLRIISFCFYSLASRQLIILIKIILKYNFTLFIWLLKRKYIRNT